METIAFFAAKPYDFKQFVGLGEDKAEYASPQTDKHVVFLHDVIVTHNPFWNETELCLRYQLNNHTGRATLKMPENETPDYNVLAYRLSKKARNSIEEFLGCDGLVFLQDKIEEYIRSIFTKSGVYTKAASEAIQDKARKLPGVENYVNYPCSCLAAGFDKKQPLFHVIIHLNDKCGWSREDIADWIDMLHDEGVINAEFEPWEEEMEKV